MFTNTNNNVVASLTSLANVSNAVFKASLTGVLCLHAGASTPYKRWSKCTMKKIGGGKVFAGT